MRLHSYRTLSLVLCTIAVANAHGSHEQIVLADDADWATRHLAEEHHIQNFDAASFFKLHDFDSSGFWSGEEIKRTYGLLNEEADDVPDYKKVEVAAKVISLFDRDGSGDVSYEEFVQGSARGIKLPDFGLGPGHHGDYEYEYEIHHWEKYHGDDTTEEDLTHPEDIEHFKKHEEEERILEKEAEMAKRTVIMENIPAKFLVKKRNNVAR